MKLSQFDFSLPPELIAQAPAEIRDRSRLMVLNRKSGSLEEGEFRDILKYLLPGDLLVLNNTKVFPARLIGEKEETHGKVEALLVHPLDRNAWTCLIKGKVKNGQRLVFANHHILGIVEEGEGAGKYRVRFSWEGDFHELLDQYGRIPLPPYIKREAPSMQDRSRYQTVFAQHWGAVAAPTAGFHFTDALLQKIKAAGAGIAFVTLHVGPGTFQPVREEEIERHVMEKERYFVRLQDIEMIVNAKAKGGRIIAVGTTSSRVLETLYLHGTPPLTTPVLEGWTDLFITPEFRFNALDALVTNFHLPFSTLLMLVCAFGGYDLIMRAYAVAIHKRYRFYSYGDAMFIV